MPLRPPTEEECELGIGYTSCIIFDPSSSGAIYTNSDPAVVRWRASTDPSRNPLSPVNLLSKPEFVVVDEITHESLRIRRTRRIPAAYAIMDDDTIVGMIYRTSVLRNKYLIKLSDGPTWTISMPLFTVRFGGYSNSETNLWIRVWPTKCQWCVLLNHGEDDRRLLASIAFIHREWWCYS